MSSPTRIRSTVAMQGGCFVILGAPFIAIGALALVLSAGNAEVGVGGILAMSLFPLFGGLIAGFGAWKLVQAAKFSPVHLDLDAPASPGSVLSGRVEASFRNVPASVTCALECWRHVHMPRRGKRGGGVHVEKVDELRVDVPASEISRPAPRRASIPVRIAIPAGWPPIGEGRDEQGRKTFVRLQLDCSSALEGADFHAIFPVTPHE
jgi:hypothetical protein